MKNKLKNKRLIFPAIKIVLLASLMIGEATYMLQNASAGWIIFGTFISTPPTHVTQIIIAIVFLYIAFMYMKAQKTFHFAPYEEIFRKYCERKKGLAKPVLLKKEVYLYIIYLITLNSKIQTAFTLFIITFISNICVHILKQGNFAAESLCLFIGTACLLTGIVRAAQGLMEIF